MHISKSLHSFKAKEGMLFVSHGQEDFVEIAVSELPTYASSGNGTISIGLRPSCIQHISEMSCLMHKAKRGGVYGLTLPAHLLDQAWRSKTPEALLVEILVSLTRLGYSFDTNVSNFDFVPSFMARTTGRWNGWRNFSKRVVGRNTGEAVSGSILSETLEVLGNSMPRYAQWLKRETVSPESRRVLEIGAGTGTMTLLFAESAFVVAFEPSESARETLSDNSREFENIVTVSSIEEAKSLGPYDEVVLINVLEHVEHDTALLRQARDLLVVGGRLTVLSPAHNMLYSDFDASIGHVRRYTRSNIERTLQISGFTEVESKYFNAIGAFLWFLVNRLAKKSEASSGQTNLYDKFVVPVSDLVNRLRIRPIGQSVIAHGKKQ